jgi:chemotaxis protein methyltransferase CheR
MTSAVLSPPVFAILSGLVRERVGIAYDERDRELFSDKVLTRMREAGFESPLDYYYYLRYDAAAGGEFDALVESLVVPETYFFREAEALRAVVEQAVRPIVDAGRRARIWSAACASGDEPITLRIMLADANLSKHVDIVASDVSLRALRRARENGWGMRSLRVLPFDAARRWMHVDASGGRVSPEIVDAIDWRRVNLVDDAAVASLGTFDVILCRNVLIYFDDETVVRVVDSLTRALRSGGRILVGASESLMRFGTMLECEERGGAFFYRKAQAP